MDEPTQPQPASKLSDYGYIAYGVERLFLFLEYATFLQRVVGLKPRGEHHKDLASATKERRFALVREHARRSDHYVLCFIVGEAVSLAVASLFPCLYSFRVVLAFTVTLCWYRIIDIIQLIGNRLVFGPLRGLQQHRMASGVRTLILTVIAYAELELIFAILYFVWRCDFKDGCKSVQDCIYFSAITQLTIGYGDILPQNGLRYLAITQGTLGFLFGVVLVARLISELPRVSGDLEHPPAQP